MATMKHYCPRMATMNRPCYAAIRHYSPEKPSLIFVSSRRQTRLTAVDLIGHMGNDDSGGGNNFCRYTLVVNHYTVYKYWSRPPGVTRCVAIPQERGSTDGRLTRL